MPAKAHPPKTMKSNIMVNIQTNPDADYTKEGLMIYRVLYRV